MQKNNSEQIITEVSSPKMLNFKEFFGKEKRGTRQQRGVTGQTRLHQNLMPEMHKEDPSLNRKVEDMRDHGANTKKVLNAQDLGFITNKYGIKNISKESPRQLGTTGIKLYYDINLGGWCLGRE